ncbi:MAG: hypothetical protein K2P57_07955 [Burkholderiales bacterium]|nr:hypothetical protein [Burkholderiales bacterium]
MKNYQKTCCALLVAGLFAPCAQAEGIVTLDEAGGGTKRAASAKFEIKDFVLEGATLFSEVEIDKVLAPFIGKGKDFTDVQRAQKAIETAYAAHGLSAVSVILPEQKVQDGVIHLHVIESHFGRVAVHGNRFYSEANVLKSIPSVRSAGIPRQRQITRDLRLANENPSKQTAVVLKQGSKPDEVDAELYVTDSNPSMFGITLDNTGSPETGNTRLGLTYSNANLFDADQVLTVQYLTSPQFPNRVNVLGAGYKLPLYRLGDSAEFFAGYSNVNSVVGGLANFQGGGALFSARYNHFLEKLGKFDQRIAFGVDWRDFFRVEQTNPAPVILYREVAVLPVSVSYLAQGKYARSDLNVQASLSKNIPVAGNGGAADFAAYDPSGNLKPNVNYTVARYEARYNALLGEDWQFRALASGQYSRDTLIFGEQMRLGGADAVRGFAEGSESGDRGLRMSVEGYSPKFGAGKLKARVLAFFDEGQVSSSIGSARSSISGAGLGLRVAYSNNLSCRLDMARIINAGTDPKQRVGDWRAHVSITATF